MRRPRGAGDFRLIAIGSAAVVGLALLLLTACSGGAPETSEPSRNTETSMAITLPPIDRDAPAEFHTATFAFG